MGQVISSNPSAIQIGAGVLGSLISLGLYKILAYVFRHTEYKNLPGPERGHILYGNMKAVMKAEPSEVHAQWEEEYGHVYVYHGLGNRLRLFTTDVRALAHILQRTDIYHKPATTQQILGQLLGWGVLVAEGDQHRIQRKALNPAFGPGQLRDLTGIFLDKANELRDVWSSLSSSSGPTRIDALTYLNRTTLDIIGLAGFGYSFDTLSSGTGEEATNEMDLAFRRLFSAAQGRPISNVLGILFPFWRHVPTPANLQIKSSMNVMRRVGTQLLDERKAAALAEAAQGEKISTSRARDLLSLLVRANTAADPRERLSDEDVLAQIPTFLVAGHETTSSLLSWILFCLSLNPDVEKNLRQECRANPLPSTAALGNEPLTAEELSALDHLPILDAVIRETLRLHSPVVNTMRCAVKDDVIPLSRPFTDKNGRVQDSIRVAKGDDMYIPIMLVNRSPDLWGPDAKQWDPFRWTDGRVTESVKGIPGIWGNVLSFLGGSHACIGYRFSLYETKIILHALITAFSFELAVPQAEIGARSKVVTRPIVKSEAARGSQMPLFIRRVDDDA